ncbi:MAG: NAD-dependent epimerase/dehydratase family protein, partial [Candidatus Aminicenantes bacterium]|nr:NAD-dependent epimerase/dehydratase family protein [Candidatus Aminicenantes bacterium]
MKCLVTGAAGFIGSHLCRRLLEEGEEVVGIDCFTDYYAREIKEGNLRPLLSHNRFKFLDQDINGIELSPLMASTDTVFHLAAQAGVRASWGEHFSIYTRNNIEASQRLLEASREIPIHKFIYASSSSVYGTCPELPMRESSPLHPYSPYGVSKLAAEHLCGLYFQNYEVPTVSLRFFTVYGPGQRPDMAFHKFLKAQLEGSSISVYGDGTQTRDFTYIDDIINGIFSARKRGKPGEVYNLGGGNRKKLNSIFPILEKITGKRPIVNRETTQKGDVPHTFASIEKAQL